MAKRKIILKNSYWLYLPIFTANIKVGFGFKEILYDKHCLIINFLNGNNPVYVLLKSAF